jgi:hypothetical protein
MTQARRMTNRMTDEERQKMRGEMFGEALDYVRQIADDSDDFASFKEGLLQEPEGQQALTVADVRQMSPEAINASWPQVQAAMEASGAPAPPPTTDPPVDQGRRATGQQMLSEGANGPEALSFDVLRRLSPEEHISRRQEIDDWLSGGGQAA